MCIMAQLASGLALVKGWEQIGMEALNNRLSF